ncbi:hypothetical protein DSLASN_42420 [Desulfoluna limicola]|uniref:Cytochrome c-552/4 domain-containing protein n=1 Tax=Desulfoluna limicola TaxID=2810562 RepID=A0ABN6F9Q3_9BACT|nr:hypothetical protein [Desulfoluna limicola]BCS98610.1 hypothetical protein DSLASN_42420 [Desulfoluna limicola]
MEFDRDGLRYDDRLAQEPVLSDSLDGDYHKSRWDQSGVVEADCFVCHLPGYFYRSRLDQLARENFRWAVVAGSGLGQVEGAVRAGEKPSVVYNRRFFNEDGTVVIRMNSSPSSENCLFCHGLADLIKRGFSWNDHVNHDVHNANGVACTACHPGDGEHNFAKGDENLSTVRDDLDNTMRTCRDCHELGYMGAPKPSHYSIRPNHLEKLACEVCHIPFLGRSAAAGLDVATGQVVNYPTGGADKIGDGVSWMPSFYPSDDGRLQPVNPFAANLYTNRDAHGIYHPLFLKELAQAYTVVGGQLEAGGDGGPLVDTDDEIVAYLAALRATLEGNPRFGHVDPHYHMGGLVYSLQGLGQLVVEKDTSWVATPDAFNINHNVAPTQMALGAGGCSDCHGERAHLFVSWLNGGGGSGGRAEEMTLWGGLSGGGTWVYYLSQLHEYNALKIYMGPFFMLIVGALVFCRFLRNSAKHRAYSLTQHQDTFFSGHWLRSVRFACFTVIVLTGYLFFFNQVDILTLLFASPAVAIRLHWLFGLVFVFAVTLDYLTTRGDRRKPWWGAVMLATGGGLIFRGALSPNSIYLLSICHSFFAFLIVAMVVARGYWGWGRQRAMLQRMEKRLCQESCAEK